MKFLALLFCFPLFGLDLEHNIAPFVLETKQIIIPEFPHAFNPSIVRHNNRLLLSFRSLPNMKDKFQSDIYLVYLDEEFRQSSKPQKLNLRFMNQEVPCRADDARLIYVGNRLYLVYSDNTDLKVTTGGYRMHIAELCLEKGQFFAGYPERISEWEDHIPTRREKNWVPFEHNGELLLSYSLDPHKVLCPIYGTETCDTVAISEKTIDWDWGPLRGGTPALLENGEYLAFFHSQKRMISDHSLKHSGEKEVLHYFMGAYTFSPHPPFEVTRFSPEPIWGKNFYHGANYQTYWFPVRVVFPCGFISDNEHIYISYGRQDHEMWIAKLDKKGLYESLVPLKKDSPTKE